MSKQNQTPGTLNVIFRKGRYGNFPVGTLATDFGTFECRDKWLETLDAGSYQGTFDIDEIALSGYMTKGPVREQRTFIKAVVSNYSFTSMKDEVSESELHSLDDPICDEINQEDPVFVPQIIDEQEPETSKSDMITLIRQKINDNNWGKGDSIAIPAELDRADQRLIRDYLIDSGYKIIDPTKRTWAIKEHENV